MDHMDHTDTTRHHASILVLTLDSMDSESDIVEDYSPQWEYEPGHFFTELLKQLYHVMPILKPKTLITTDARIAGCHALAPSSHDHHTLLWLRCSCEVVNQASDSCRKLKLTGINWFSLEFAMSFRHGLL